MKWRVALLCGLLILSACQTVEERKDRVRGLLRDGQESASGTLVTMQRHLTVLWERVTAIIVAGRRTADRIEETANDINRRVEKVQEGLEKLQEGKKLVEQGLLQGRGD